MAGLFGAPKKTLGATFRGNTMLLPALISAGVITKVQNLADFFFPTRLVAIDSLILKQH